MEKHATLRHLQFLSFLKVCEPNNQQMLYHDNKEHLSHEIMRLPLLNFCAYYRNAWNEPHSLAVVTSN